MGIHNQIRSHSAYVKPATVEDALENLYRRHMHLVLSNPLTELNYAALGGYYVALVGYADVTELVDDVDWVPHDTMADAMARMEQDGTSISDSIPWIETHKGITKLVDALRLTNDQNRMYHYLESIDGVETLIILVVGLAVLHGVNAETAAMDYLNKLEETIE